MQDMKYCKIHHLHILITILIRFKYPHIKNGTSHKDKERKGPKNSGLVLRKLNHILILVVVVVLHFRVGGFLLFQIIFFKIWNRSPAYMSFVGGSAQDVGWLHTERNQQSHTHTALKFQVVLPWNHMIIIKMCHTQEDPLTGHENQNFHILHSSILLHYCWYHNMNHLVMHDIILSYLMRHDIQHFYNTYDPICKTCRNKRQTLHIHKSWSRMYVLLHRSLTM